MEAAPDEAEEDSQPRTVCAVTFSFEDIRVLDLQQYCMTRNLSHTIIGRPPRLIEGLGPRLDHRHEGDKTFTEIGLLWVGPPHILTGEFVLEQATVRVLGWLRDNGLPDISFATAEIKTGILGVDCPTDMERRDMTIEAHVIESRLLALDQIQPSDFI
ncbi:MAG TPA: hypothetical protein VMR34_04485 [Candidatus Saccharimonadales bacterium]|nr:hypothetical protein [Candidatus Saccharimonadales bacterium]